MPFFFVDMVTQKGYKRFLLVGKLDRNLYGDVAKW